MPLFLSQRPIALGVLGAALLVGVSAGTVLAQTRSAPTASPASSAGRFPLTVDSIMRGPDLVGYPPSGLRWSGDSARLFFEWQGRGEDETATWVVTGDGAGLRRLSEEERRPRWTASGIAPAAAC